MNTKQNNNTYIANTYARYDIAATHGSGALLYDEDGREFIDCTSGVGSNAFGHCDPVMVDAIAQQAGKLIHSSNYFYNQPATLLAQAICERTGMSKVFFCNSGTEATEGAIKAVRKYSHDKYGRGREKILTLRDSFHGRTMAALTATGQDSFHQHFFPFLPGFEYIDADDIVALDTAMDSTVCALFIEVVQGEGGVNVLSQDFLQTAAKLAAERDILLVVDEVQTGNGRCGSLYGYMNFGIKPDIFYTAKGLGGGMPIGAIVFSEKTAGVLSAGHHGSTFGGNPLCAAAALSVFERLDDALFIDVWRKYDMIDERLRDLPQVKSISGMGLLIGIELEGVTASEVVQKCMAQGVIFLTAKHKLRILPPLNITDEQLTKALDVLVGVLGS